MKKLPTLTSLLVVLGLCMAGLAVLYYAFELVSVPYIKEYNAEWWVILGLIITGCGVGLGLYTYLSARTKQTGPEQPPAL